MKKIDTQEPKEVDQPQEGGEKTEEHEEAQEEILS
jgi:hypothetical protein